MDFMRSRNTKQVKAFVNGWKAVRCIDNNNNNNNNNFYYIKLIVSVYLNFRNIKTSLIKGDTQGKNI